MFILGPTDDGTEFFGGAGLDTVDYSKVTTQPAGGKNPISLDDKTNDGVKGADNIHSDIENIYASEFSDVIFGSRSTSVTCCTLG